MANSPSRNALQLPSSASASTTHLNSPRSTRTLRKLQSAHALSSNYAALNTPSLISQQRQQQQRNTVSSQVPGTQDIPPLPLQRSHQRMRSNSDAVVPNFSNSGPSSARRNILPKKTVVMQSPKDELESLVRQGPRGDVPTGLQRLRHLILCDGLEADGDGMVGLRIRDVSSINETYVDYH